MTTYDSHKNFAYSTIAVAPVPASSGVSITVATGDGTKFPAVPFNATICPSGVSPTVANAEIVRVTLIATDVLTITRTQESTSARTIIVGDQIFASITAKTLTDVETQKADLASPTFTGTPTLPTGTIAVTQSANDNSTKIATTAYVDALAAATLTLANKRINPRLVTATSYTTDTGTSLDVSTCDQFEITAQAGALLFNNISGTPLGGQKIIIRIKDNGTARALTYGTQYRALGNALPTTTVASKTLYMGFIWNNTDTKLDLVAVSQES